MPVYNFCAGSAQPFRRMLLLQQRDDGPPKKLSQLAKLVKIAIQSQQRRTPVVGDLCFNSLRYDQYRTH